MPTHNYNHFFISNISALINRKVPNTLLWIISGREDICDHFTMGLCQIHVWSRFNSALHDLDKCKISYVSKVVKTYICEILGFIGGARPWSLSYNNQSSALGQCILSGETLHSQGHALADLWALGVFYLWAHAQAFWWPGEQRGSEKQFSSYCTIFTRLCISLDGSSTRWVRCKRFIWAEATAQALGKFIYKQTMFKCFNRNKNNFKR